MASFFSFVDSKLQKMHWYEVSLLKLSVFAFALLAAKLYPQLLSLAWYWYAAVFAVPAAWLLYSFFLKK